MTTPTPPLDALTLRRLLRVEANLADLHNVLSAVQTGCRRERELPGVDELLALLERFAADLDKAHPADRFLPRPVGPIDSNPGGDTGPIDLSE